MGNIPTPHSILLPYVIIVMNGERGEHMGKIRRGGYIFLTWKGDHDPRHVHVLKNGRLVLKWNLDKGKVMSGRSTRQILKLIESLVREGGL